MRRIGVAKFKQECLALLDRLDREGLIITKHGKPIARVTPYETSSAELIGALKDRLHISGDITATGVRWDAES